MSDIEQVLQESLLALESGVPLEQVLARLPANSEEVAGLIRTAAAVRTTDHPSPSAEKVNAATERAFQTSLASQQSSRSKNPSQRGGNLWLFPAFGFLIFIVIGCIIFSFSTGVFLKGPGSVQAALLTDVTGLVEKAPSADSSAWTSVSSGTRITAGQRIRTDVSSYVTLVFYEGSRTLIGPNSDVTISKLDGGWGGSLQVLLTENAGATTSEVVPFNGKNSSFVIRTPSGDATVHGTHFNVYVTSSGLSRYSVITGEVAVKNTASQVNLQAGQAATSLSGEDTINASYQFSVQGELTFIEGSTWTVNNVQFTITKNTVIIGTPAIGDLVTVQGRILKGDWIADQVELAEDETTSATFSGLVDSMGQNDWVVGGITVEITGTTQISDGIQLKDPVEVTYNPQADGTRLAQRIELLQFAPVPSAKPELGFKPSGLSVKSCEETTTIPATLINHGPKPGDDANDVTLSYVIDKGGEFVDQVTLTPTDFLSVGPGKTAPFDIQVDFTPDWLSAKNGSEVKLHIIITHETNRPDHLNARLNVSIQNSCNKENEATGTPTITPTPTLTPTPTPTGTLPPSPTPTFTPTPTATPSESPTPVPARCENQPNPKAYKLANYYQVPVEEIVGWFCQGFGFGEIDLAYSLAREANVPVASVFDLRKSGLGWGQIKHQLLGKPGNNKP